MKTSPTSKMAIDTLRELNRSDSIILAFLFEEHSDVPSETLLELWDIALAMSEVKDRLRAIRKAAL